MAWLAVDETGKEIVFSQKPFRMFSSIWVSEDYDDNGVQLPQGSIKKLIGRDLTWEDDPVELA